MPRGFTQKARAARQRLFEVEITGAAAIIDQLRGRRFVDVPTRRLIENTGVATRKTAQRAAKPHPGDKGTLGRAIRLSFSRDGSEARVDIARSVAGIAFTIEEGRRPGRRPPHGPIKRWMISHGIISAGRGTSKQIREVREQIKLRGTRGVHFMAQALEVANEVLRRGVPQTEQEIRDLWNRG